MIYYSWVTSAASGCKFSKEKIKKSSINCYNILWKNYRNKWQSRNQRWGHPPGKHVDAGYCSRCSSSCKTDIHQPSFEVMPRICVLFGVTVDCLLCRGGKRFLDISALSDQEAAVVCGMVEILKKKNGFSV